MSRGSRKLLSTGTAGVWLAIAGVLKVAERSTSPSLTRALWESKDVSKRCAKLFGGLSIAGTRSFVVTAYMHLTFEHQAAIVSLFARGWFGAANALLRPCIEAATRGMWLAKCASDSQVEEFASGKKFEFPHFTDLVHAIEVRVNPQVNTNTLFARFGGKDAWRVINDFCHGGNIHVARRTKAGQMQPSYPEPELRSCLILATSAVLLATHTVLQIAVGDHSSEIVRLKATADRYVRNVVLPKAQPA